MEFVVIAVWVFIGVGMFIFTTQNNKKNANNKNSSNSSDPTQNNSVSRAKKISNNLPANRATMSKSKEQDVFGEGFGNAYQKAESYKPYTSPFTTISSNLDTTMSSNINTTIANKFKDCHDDYCAVEHKTKPTYRVESNIPTTNSIGGKSTEGCDRHYDKRFVMLDIYDEADNQEELNEMARAIILGEVLGKPKCKK